MAQSKSFTTSRGDALIEPMVCPIINEEAAVVRNVRYAPNCTRLTLSVPYRHRMEAGQFVHLRVDNTTYPLLRRPFSIYDITPRRKGCVEMDILFTHVGHGTEILSRKKPHQRVMLMGPLGRGFMLQPWVEHAIFIAGGIGIVPFYIFAKQIWQQKPRVKITLLFGARNKEQLYGLADFQKLGVETLTATDDGSIGAKGFITTLLERYLDKPDARQQKKTHLYACGPEPMLDRVVHIVKQRNLPCEVSLEKRMGCALGACAACVTKVATSNDDFRYSRICIEGPTYDAHQLVTD